MGILDFLKRNNNPTFRINMEMFLSSDHIRYEKGVHISGPHGGAPRGIKIELIDDNKEIYNVTIYNMDDNHPIWGNNIMMTPKQMKVLEISKDKIILRGHGLDKEGNDFSDYGLTIYLKNGQFFNCILHMHDKWVDIEYLP